ncbi:DUF4179 domain-containing protein [Paenibacillus pasadenensis]|uniref:DUF4179 domain-containing protein n=1 Tax=Paenibacillus pasadenensis TaxID=217090 RepID=A0A2N5NB04_9BACL|nr:DUF4179 domain-containing protein [Paenibacillus pasadenensis]PLT47526.1 hypothetical protein B8V81_1750 [Paenibacillus pasadenensis]
MEDERKVPGRKGEEGPADGHEPAEAGASSAGGRESGRTTEAEPSELATDARLSEAEHAERAADARLSEAEPLELVADGRLSDAELAELAADERLRAAIRAGLERGKRRSRPRRRRRLGLGLAAALISLLALTAGAAKVSPAFADALRSVPSLSGFLRLIGENPALLSSIDRDLLQIVGRTAEKDGKWLTVEALVADERRLVVFYRTNLQEFESVPLRLSMLDGQGQVLSAGYSSGYTPPSSELEGSEDSKPDMIDVQMSPGERLPEQVLLRVNQAGVMLEVPLDIDLNKSAGLVREFPLNRTLEIEGQKLTVVSARQTPLQLELKLRKDPANTMEIRDLLNLRLTDEAGREWRSTMGFLGDEPVMLFQNGYFQKPKRLTLRADGFVMFAKGQQIVVDAERRIVLEAPDDRVSLVSPDTTIQRGQVELSNLLAFRLSGLDERESKYGYDLVSASFTDGMGRQRQTVHSENSIGWTSSTEGQTIFVELPEEKLPQPLTFDVTSYPGYALRPIEVEMLPD